MAKPLFVLVDDGGDGSYSVRYTMNRDWIDHQQNLYDDGELEYPALGVDGDGFHYSVMLVPDECTLESLGIKYDCAGN